MARTVIDLDEEILSRALQLSGLRKKVDVVNFALRKLVEQKEIEGILGLKGTVEWEGDLEQMRKDRHDPR